MKIFFLFTESLINMLMRYLQLCIHMYFPESLLFVTYPAQFPMCFLFVNIEKCYSPRIMN